MIVEIVGVGDHRKVRVSAPDVAGLARFEGTAGEAPGGTVLEGPLSEKNASAVRASLPWLQPKPVGLATSAGTGDRLGMSTRGHAMAFDKYGAGVIPVFAQQSMREMDRLQRSPQQVLDDATFGALEAGWDRQVGADADHLKTTEDIDRCLSARFTSFTIDPGEHVRTDLSYKGDLGALPWGALEDDETSFLRRYKAGLDTGESVLRLGGTQLRRAAHKYGAAVAHTVSMYRHLMARADYPVEVEVSVDETDDPTTVAEHVYMATELKRLGVKWVGYAPRYIGGFEKGVEYIGDTALLAESLRQHFVVAAAIGPYKLSLHSGSDKFSIYGLAVEATGGMLHLKTSGTTYLVALGVVAKCAPVLFREIYDLSRKVYRGARASYQVSAVLSRTPAPSEVADESLGELLDQFDSRQILHVGYGEVLTAEDGGERRLYRELRALLTSESDYYAHALETHLGRHLTPLSEVR